LAATWKAMRAGMLALMTPVMTSTDGRWVATMQWMPRGARHLRDAGDGHFDVGRRDQHQVGQLVDDDHDVGELLGNDDVLVARHDDLLVDLHGKPVGARARLFPCGRSAAVPAPSAATACPSGRSLNDLMLRTPTRAKIW
jgi:hypothetical protein